MLLLLAVCTGCEKEILTEEATKPTSGNSETPAIVDEGKDEALTVAEAQQVADGTPIVVKAYIVASTTRSIKNADFEAPFEGSTAIVLADECTDDPAYYDEDDLFPVCLTDRKNARAALNLEDNPDICRHLVYLYGTKERYMSRAGLKKVDNWEIIP